jgi:FdhE protein
VRQGEVASKGSWTGSPQGGVQTPDPLILPDPKTRFARIAARLEILADGHPMSDWLRFMARLAEAQQAAATALGPIEGPAPAAVLQAVEARMPPLAADGHRRASAWRHGLALLLDSINPEDLPALAREVMVRLRSSAPEDLEALADGFLTGDLDPADAGAALYVTAALQVYFTRLAADLAVDDLRLLEERGLCPCCGSTPVAGMVTASGGTPGTRYLHCSLCATAWNHVRATCITCGESRTIALKGVEGDNGAIKAETCDDCHTYSKAFYLAKDTKLDPVADDLASVGLDVLVAEGGWLRHAPNPFLLIG